MASQFYLLVTNAHGLMSGGFEGGVLVGLFNCHHPTVGYRQFPQFQLRTLLGAVFGGRGPFDPTVRREGVGPGLCRRGDHACSHPELFRLITLGEVLEKSPG